METQEPSKRRRWRRPIFLAVAFVAAGVGVFFFLKNPYRRAWLDPEFLFAVERFAEVMFVTNGYYYDEDRVGFAELTDQALIGMTTSLDRFSNYMPPDAFAKYRAQSQNNYVGTGFRSWNFQGEHVVARVYPGSPAERAGLEIGNHVLKVDGAGASQWTDDEFTAKLRGPEGTEVVLEVKGPTGVRTLTLRRSPIHTNAVVNHWVDAEGIGYLKLDQFTPQAGAEVREVLSKMQSRPIQGIVLDLRNNGGGKIETTVDVAGLFLPSDSLITRLESRRPELSNEYRTKKEAILIEVPMVVLVNGFSASGSEALAGALQWYERAVLVGERTFGKGSAQQVFEGDDATAITLTIARYLLPDGTNVDGKGLDPDHLVIWEVGQETQARIQQAIAGRIDPTGFKSLFGVDPLPDPQMAKALEILRRSIQESESKLESTPGGASVSPGE